MRDAENILNGISWPKKGGHFSKEPIENKVRFGLPEDYIFFLENYAGYETTLGTQYFVFWDEAELLSLNEGYEVQYYFPDMLAIGSNGGGEMIGLQNKGDATFKVILVPFGSFRYPEQQVTIGDSFTDFLRRMDNGESWFKGRGVAST
jgi:hypothetical protein